MKTIISFCIAFLASMCTAAETEIAYSPIAFTLSSSSNQVVNYADVILTAQYTNIGTNEVSVYDRLPLAQGEWFRWTRLLISTGNAYMVLPQGMVRLISIPPASPIVLKPGQSHRFSIPLKNFSIDWTDMPDRVDICARYVIKAPYLANHQGVWLGTETSNVVTLERTK